MTGYVKGFVRDAANGLGIGNASITVYGNTSPVIDSNGTYLVAVPAGTVSLTASAPGYVSLTKTVNVGVFEFVTLHFDLVAN